MYKAAGRKTRKACFVLETRSFLIYEKMMRRNVSTTGKASPSYLRKEPLVLTTRQGKNASLPYLSRSRCDTLLVIYHSVTSRLSTTGIELEECKSWRRVACTHLDHSTPFPSSCYFCNSVAFPRSCFLRSIFESRDKFARKRLVSEHILPRRFHRLWFPHVSWVCFKYVRERPRICCIFLVFFFFFLFSGTRQAYMHRFFDWLAARVRGSRLITSILLIEGNTRAYAPFHARFDRYSIAKIDHRRSRVPRRFRAAGRVTGMRLLSELSRCTLRCRRAIYLFTFFFFFFSCIVAAIANREQRTYIYRENTRLIIAYIRCRL